jgi:hypothetical protein
MSDGIERRLRTLEMFLSEHLTAMVDAESQEWRSICAKASAAGCFVPDDMELRHQERVAEIRNKIDKLRLGEL